MDLNEKARKIAKKQETHILFGLPSEEEFWEVKLHRPISEMNQVSINSFINRRIKPYLSKGQVILNTNV